MSAVFVTTGPLGDAATLAAGLSTTTSTIQLGIRTNLSTEPHRHPTVLAREMTTFDLISGGRSLLAFTPPFSDGVIEAIALCRAMWRDGVAASDGPTYPVAGAINRPQPRRPGGPPIARGPHRRDTGRSVAHRRGRPAVGVHRLTGAGRAPGP